MMVIEESNLKFTFQQNLWEVVKFDDKDNVDYQKVSERIQNTKAVDFIGIQNAESLFFFEIKNLRAHTKDPESQRRLANGAEDLTSEIAQKVRDSVACIVGASRNSTNEVEFWQKVLNIIMSNNDFKIIAWIEEDIENDSHKKKYRKSVLATRNSKLKNKLNWLTSRVFIESIKEREIQINGLTVEYK